MQTHLLELITLFALALQVKQLVDKGPEQVKHVEWQVEHTVTLLS